MTPYPVKGARLPIPFHRLLKVVAICDRLTPQIQALLDSLRQQHCEVEVTENYVRDVDEDADVGAYIALVDGERLEPARKLARAVRAIGFRTPLWALADAHRISDMAVHDLTGEVDGYIYLGQQTPDYYAKQYAMQRAVTAADVQRVANRYLGPGRVVLSVVPLGKPDQASRAEASARVVVSPDGGHYTFEGK